MKKRIALSHFHLPLWKQSQLYPSKNIECPTIVMKMHKKVNDLILSKAFEVLAKRHTIFHCKIQTDDKNIFFEQVEISKIFKIVNFKKEISTSWSVFFQSLTQHPFILHVPPLIRATLVKDSPFDDLLIIIAHHLCVDAWSMEHLIYELDEVAYKIVNQNKIDIKNDDLFKDILKSKEIKKRNLISYSSMNKKLNLPYDFKPRKRKDQFRGVRHFFSHDLNEELLKNIVQIPFRRKVLGASAWLTLIHKICHEKRIEIGIPFTTHYNPKKRTSFGCFTRLFPLQIEIEKSMNFYDVFKKVNRELFKVLRNRMSFIEKNHFDIRFSFYEITKKENKSHDSMAFLLNEKGGPVQLKYMKVSSERIKFQNTNVKLSLFLLDSAEKLSGYIQYDPLCFSPSTIKRWSSFYREIYSQMIQNPSISLGEVNLIKKSFEVSKPKKEPPFSDIYSKFENTSNEFPHRTALSGNQLRWTYHQLNEISNKVAYYLRKKNIQKQDRICLGFMESEFFVPYMLAVLKIGAIYVPLDLNWPHKRIEKIIKQVEPKLIITEENFNGADLSKFQILSTKEMRHCIKNSDSFESTTFQSAISENDTAYLIFTSGSTGSPKGVEVSHKNVLQLFSSTEKIVSQEPHHVWSVFHSFSFDFSVWELFGALLSGGRAHLFHRKCKLDFLEFLKTIKKESVTVLSLTPSSFFTLLETCKIANESLNNFPIKYVILGGEKLDFFKLNTWFDLNSTACLINMLGMTEATIHSTFIEVKKILNSSSDYIYPSLIGEPLPNHNIYILDKNKNILADTIPGEIVIQGPGVSKGYWRDKKLTKEKFIILPNGERAYRSGDLGRFRSDGILEFLGRSDRQVKVNGHRIELDEIEHILTKITNSIEVATILHKGKIVAFVNKDSESVKKQIGKFLPFYMIPSQIIEINPLPKTKTQKIDFEDLKKRISKSHSYVPSRNRENYFLTIIKDLLTRTFCFTNIDYDKNLFDLGIDSLQITQFLTHLNKKYGYKIDILLIYRLGSIRSIVELLKKKFKKRQVPLNNGQKYLFFQNQMNKRNTEYNLSFAFKISKKILFEKMKEAIKKTLLDYPILSSIIDLKGECMHYRPDFHHFNIKRSEVKSDLNLFHSIKIEHQKLFHLEREFPIRWSFFYKKNSHFYILLVNLHHIAIDVRSFEILIERLFAHLENNVKSLKNSEISPDFSTFSRYQDSIKRESKYDRNTLEVYVKELGKTLTPYSFPFWASKVFNLSNSLDSKIGNQLFKGPIKNSLKFTEKLKKKGYSLIDLFLALTYCYLTQLSERHYFIIGHPRSWRKSQENNLIGFFHNVELLVFKNEKFKDFDLFLKKVKKIRNQGSCPSLSYPLISNLFFQKYKKQLPIHVSFSYYEGLEKSLPFLCEDSSQLTNTTLGSISPLKLNLNQPIFDVMISVYQNSHKNYLSFLYKKQALNAKIIKSWGEYFIKKIHELEMRM